MIDIDVNAGLVPEDSTLLFKYRRYCKSANVEVTLPFSSRKLYVQIDSQHLPWHQPEADEYSYELTRELELLKRYYHIGEIQEL